MEISVIVPIYNVEAYLPRCVDSLLHQSFTDYEIILVDDGATDGSPALCDAYAAREERVRTIHKQNGGLSDARNAGIDAASGAYLAFVDSDDWVDDDFLKVLYENAVQNDADISVVNFHKSFPERYEPAPSAPEGLYTGEQAITYLYADISIYVNIACNKLYKKELFETIRYPVGKLHEDGLTTYKLLFAAKRVYFSDRDLYSYFQRGDSIMNQRFTESRIDEYQVYTERALFFKERGLTELFRKNEDRRAVCMKTLTVKLAQSDIKNKGKWYKIFRADFRENAAQRTPPRGRLGQISDCVFAFSPRAFYRMTRIKGMLGKGKRRLRERQIMHRFCADVRAAQRSGKPYAFLLLTPAGGNLGDHALTLSTQRLLCDMLLVEMPCSHMSVYAKHWETVVKKIGGSLILMNPGGNLGTLWFAQTEAYIRKCIESFPNNKIIILPQTCYYEDSAWGRAEFEKSKAIYNAHPDLTVYAREEISYDLMRGQYRDVRLMPDMVMSLCACEEYAERRGALLCIRADHEKTMPAQTEQTLFRALEALCGSVERTDTVVPGAFDRSTREAAVEKKLAQFRSASLVVTDRLHGMVFAAITGTPCAVFDSKSPKVRGCYKWLEKLGYIRLTADVGELEDFCKTVLDKTYTYDNSDLQHYYTDLKAFVYKNTEGLRG